ncbi:PLD nuclease N-terminal domain-containing protein [Corynebacterium heidelbergense]|uniref:Cardiolipin synthase N-terminal domain-containing protein n=1 Tax=Corynebacterium heidelbergense TaxID=2055947 RepID=A0A364V718_9CORY|nr:PLD nuclease N-terminal domain-containing protein [Corynebacterium heidelbergense]RAV32408.1 hypothetical protein DLJ54_03540 [Corynebacterium heidelbergense]
MFQNLYSPQGVSPVDTVSILAPAQNHNNTTEYIGLAGFIVLSLAAILFIVLFVGALMSIVKSPNYERGGKALWALACFAFPVIGPLLWFWLGKDSGV